MNMEATIRLSIVTVALEQGITDLDKIKELVEYVMEPLQQAQEDAEVTQLQLI